MAREVVVHLWCDPCLAEDKHVEGEELNPLHLPGLTGPKPRVVALCELHRKELYQPLLDLLEEHGQPVDEEGNPSGPRGRYKKRSSSREPEPQSCPVCGHTSPNRSALASHVRSQHDTTLSELRGDPTPYECPECGLKSPRPQGLAAHRRSVHGVLGVTAKERQAEAEGQGSLLEDESSTPPKRPARKRATKKATPKT